MEHVVRKQLIKRPRLDEEKETALLLDVKKIRVVGPSTTNFTPFRRVFIEQSKNFIVPPHQRGYLETVFYKSLVDCGKFKPMVVHELDEDWPFDENMDPSLAEVWRPKMDEPLLPFVIGLRDFLKEV